MKLTIKNPRILGVLPGSGFFGAPELAFHEFKVFEDGVEHWIADTMRAKIPLENFEAYFEGQDSVVMPVLEWASDTPPAK